MRVYELSKEFGVSTKELLRVLHEGGFELKSHMAVLSEEAIAFLNKHFLTEDRSMDTEKIASTAKKENDSKRKEKKVKADTQPKLKKIVIAPMSLAQFALESRLLVNEIILFLLRIGIVATKNQVLPADVVRRLAEHYGLEIVEPALVQEEPEEVITPEEEEGLKGRLPIVVVLGHVDHGKTTLLDFIRKTRVAIKEKGGITQHIGAYEATTKHGKVVFLDTPGHEAFSGIRQRGIRVADIAILVVAADDGVMPQTIEAIKFAKSMNVPIVVAINKIDKVDEQRIEVVKRQLTDYDLLPEEWGGDTIIAPISAKEGVGVDQLLEILLLQAQIMEVRANILGSGKGYILESKIEKGYGSVATLICQHGVVKVGDYFICNNTAGRVTSLIDSYGTHIKSAGPSTPVQIAGFDSLPRAGDYFKVVPKEEYKRKRSKLEDGRKKFITPRLIQEGAISIILKTDTHSSKEALLKSIEDVSKKSEEGGFNLIHADVGDINESDVELAFNIGAHIIGFNVKTEAKATATAKRRGIAIKFFSIIYRLIDELERQIEATKKIEMIKTKVGEATVLRIFDIKGVGIVAGSYVNNGRFVREGYVVVWRKDTKVGEGKIISLQREKKAAKEVLAGFECGFVVEGITDWLENDRVECFIEVPKK